MLMTDSERISFAKRFAKIKGIGNTDFLEDVKVEDKARTQRIIATVFPENKLIKRLFSEYEAHVLQLTKISVEVSTYGIDSKTVERDGKTGVDENTEIIKQRVRIEEEDGLTLETSIEVLEPVSLKEWKGVLLNDTMVTTGLITEPSEDMLTTDVTETANKPVKEETNTNA